MKLSGAEAARYLARPDPARAGLLIFGADPMRVATRRQAAVAALIGPEGAAEMRLERIAAADLRRGGGALSDALKARGFFPGPRVVLLEEAGDAAAEACAAALAGWGAGDAVLVVTAGALAAKSSLRKLFEGDARTVAIGLYDDPPTREEIAAELARAGLREVPASTMADLADLARVLDPGDFRGTLEKIALYKHGDPRPLGADDIAACAPAAPEADLDAVLDCVAEGRLAEVGVQIGRLRAQGVGAVTICIGATRHFRTLHAAACDPEGPAAGLGRARPPVFGPRRDRLAAQARGWGRGRLEEALAMLVETDVTLRSSSRAPALALVERTLLRLAQRATIPAGERR